MEAICRLALLEEDSELNGTAGAVFDCIRPVVAQGIQRSRAGALGAEAKWKQTDSKPIANAKQYKDKDKDKDISKRKNIKKEKFTPPTREEVKSYFAEKGFSIDGDTFYDYFNESGWIDSNGKPVQNWKQKAITWQSKEKTKPVKQTPYVAPQQRATIDDIERYKKLIAEM